MLHQTCAALRTALADAVRSRHSLVARLSVRQRRILLAAAAGMSVLLLWWAFLDPAETPDLVPVLVASQYIPAFSAVPRGAASVKAYPKLLVPPGALHSLRELTSVDGQALYSSAVAIPDDQPITRNVLLDAAQTRSLSSLVSSGFTALSLGFDKVHAAGGWIQPGDVVAVFSYDLRKGTRILYSNLRVIAVDARRLGEVAPAGSDKHDEDMTVPENGCILTLLVNPVQARILLEAREQGILSVTLRGLGDDASWETPVR